MPQALSSAQIAAVKSLLAWSPEGDLHALAEQLQQLLDGFVGDLPPYEATLTRRLADYLPRLARELDLSDEPVYLPEESLHRMTAAVDNAGVDLVILADVLDDIGEHIPYGAATKNWNTIIKDLRVYAKSQKFDSWWESAPEGWVVVRSNFGVVYQRRDALGKVEPKNPEGSKWRAFARRLHSVTLKPFKLPPESAQDLKSACAAVDTWITNNAPRTP